LTSLEVSHDGNKAYVGSANGVLRIYNVHNRSMPKLIKIEKYSSQAITVLWESPNWKYLLIGAKGDKEFWIINSQTLEFECFYSIPSPVKDVTWLMLASNLMVVGILDNTCLFSVHISPNDVENKRKPVPDEVGNPNFKRIDPGSEIVICDSNTGDIYVIGNDKLFKKYELPNEAYGQLKWRTPPKDPIDEFFDHSIGVNTWDISDEQNYIATGGKDGLIKLRNRSRISASDDIKAHAIHNEGVTALCFSKFRAVLYSAGGDG